MQPDSSLRLWPTCAGELEPGEHALLHVWLVATQRGGNVTLQGFGHLQPLDVLRADRNIGHVRSTNSCRNCLTRCPDASSDLVSHGCGEAELTVCMSSKPAR